MVEHFYIKFGDRFLRSCDKQTNRQTHKSRWNPTQATGNYEVYAYDRSQVSTEL